MILCHEIINFVFGDLDHVSIIPDLAHSLTATGMPAQFSAARTTADGNTPSAYILYSFWI